MTENKSIHTIKVPDMNCQHCKMTITNTLQEMPGIQSVEINLDAREVSVETGSLERQTILDRIQKAGYKPE